MRDPRFIVKCVSFCVCGVINVSCTCTFYSVLGIIWGQMMFEWGIKFYKNCSHELQDYFY